MLQPFRGFLLEGTHLRITFKNLSPMRRRGNVSAQIFPRGVSVHMKTFGPQSAFGNIINLPLKSNVGWFSVLTLERQQFL
jgi:hypothetical protein